MGMSFSSSGDHRRPSLSRECVSWPTGERHTLVIERVHRLTDCAVESIKISEGLVGEMMCFQVAPDGLDVVQDSGAYLGNHSTVSQ